MLRPYGWGWGKIGSLMTDEVGPVTPETQTTQPSPATAAPAAEPSQFDSPYWTGEAETAGAPDSNFLGVRFQRAGKIYHYLSGGISAKVGNWVIVDTPRGRQLGQIATLNPPRNKNDGPFKRIERLATGRDMAMRHYYENKELEAMIACRAESNALGLPIKIARAEYSFDGQTLTFLFSTDQEERVETGELRQVMSRLYRARVELRQISPREVAKIIGGMGACGIEQRCCSRFLTEFSPVSIKHAKEQNLSLNPHDITGMCGRLRCCLVYEFEQYVEARRHLPKRNAIIGTPLGQGKVVEVIPMRDSVRVRIGEAEQAKDHEFHREQLVPLEELKRLQDKAASGTCDKHEGGGCDCGKGAAEATAQSASSPQASDTSSGPSRSSGRALENLSTSRESAASDAERHGRKKHKKKFGESEATTTSGPTQRQSSPQSSAYSTGRNRPNPRDTGRPQSRPQSRPQPRPQIARDDSMTPPEDANRPDTPAAGSGDRPATRRPLRKPLRPRHQPRPSTPPGGEEPPATT